MNRYTRDHPFGEEGGAVVHSVVQCSALLGAQCSAVQMSAAQCGAVQWSAVQRRTVQQSTVQCSTVQQSTVQCSTVQIAPYTSAWNDYENENAP